MAEAAKDEALVGAKLFEQRSGHDTRHSDGEIQHGQDVKAQIFHAIFLQDKTRHVLASEESAE